MSAGNPDRKVYHFVSPSLKNVNVVSPLAVESSIAVADAVENRGLYRFFVSRLFLRASDTIAPLWRGCAL